MPRTANELFRDALLRRQIALSKFERGLQTDVIGLLDATEADIRAVLADRVGELEGKAFGKTVHSRLNVLQNAIRKIRSGAFDEANSMWDSQLQDLAVHEADYLDQHLKDVSPVQLDTVMPDPTQLAGIVSIEPVSGRLLSEWAQSLEDQDVQRVMDAVRVGMAQGDTTDNIIRRVIGTRSLDGADGAVQMTRYNMAAITQTAIATVANGARQQYYEANDDIFSQEQWVATLDDATCVVCGDLDGEVYDVGDGEMTPAHINCRCVRVAIIDPDSIASRPAVPLTEDDLDGLSPDERTDMVRQMVGQVPSTVTYSDWLESQSESFQDHVLGPSRAALFRDGNLPLSKFVNSRGDTYTLDQLREREPAAFKAAGI